MGVVFLVVVKISNMFTRKAAKIRICLYFLSATAGGSGRRAAASRKLRWQLASAHQPHHIVIGIPAAPQRASKDTTSVQQEAGTRDRMCTNSTQGPCARSGAPRAHPRRRKHRPDVFRWGRCGRRATVQLEGNPTCQLQDSAIYLQLPSGRGACGAPRHRRRPKPADHRGAAPRPRRLGAANL